MQITSKNKLFIDLFFIHIFFKVHKDRSIFFLLDLFSLGGLASLVGLDDVRISRVGDGEAANSEVFT